jgi:hypothetical protein
MVQTTSARLVQFVRSLVTPPAQREAPYSNSAAVNAQFWLGQHPWRPTAAWSVIAATLATGALFRLDRLNWQTLALVLLLADPLWGSIWRLAAGRREMLPLQLETHMPGLWLPYLQPGSTAHKMLGWDSSGVMPLLSRVALPSVLIAVGLSAILGESALALTAILIVVSILGWISRRSLQQPPVLLQSIVTIAMPWLLAAHQLTGEIFAGAWATPHAALIGLCTLHHWGESRLLRNPADTLGVGLLALSEAAIFVLLLLRQTPLWLVLLVLFWLPAWLLIHQKRPLERVNFWWLLAILASAFAISNG